MNVKYVAPTLVLLAMLLAACDQSEGGSDDEKDAEDSPPVPVEVGKASRGDVYATYKGTAPIEAFADADVIAKVAGEVRQILVEEGDNVTKGQVLARLDGDRLRLELRESEARLQKLQRDFERNMDLSEKGLISAGDFDNLKYELEALRASHNLRSLELDYTQIRAPIDGIVSNRYIKLGTTLSVNDPVFRVTSFDPLVAYLHVPEREFTNIAQNQPVRLDIDALKGDPVITQITRVSPVVDPATGTFKVTIEIYDDERRIKPGMFARVSVVHDKHENALLVPRSAILEEAGKTSVFIVSDNRALRKEIQTGFASDGMVEIISGLDGDEDLVTVGQIGLKNEADVEVINAVADTNNADLNIADGSATSTDTIKDGDDAATD